MKIATQLSEEGRRVLAHALADHLSNKALTHLISAWESDVSFDVNDSQGGYMEIRAMHTKTGNPVVITFSDEEVILEDAPGEE